MPTSERQTVDMTSLIKGILNGYPGNSAIFREYLQNSDDAKATKQVFVLDERRHHTDSIVDPVLADTQGPALIAWNDQVLSDRDWTALKKIHASSKGADETQTGKNGLGFRASYHLTENPQILSGRRLLILDPHDEFKHHPGGASIDIVTEGPQYADQLSSFESILKEPFREFRGTVFRLPFRTQNQAGRSRIKNTATPVTEMKELLLNFGQELEEAILFLKHITSIEIRRASAFGDQVISSVTIDARPDDSLKAFSRRITVNISGEETRSHLWKYYHYKMDRPGATAILSKRLRYDVGDFMIAEKLTADVELALPLDPRSISGRLFTLLPLPIRTGFPVHFNAVFALTPDRQSLKNIEESGADGSRERRLVEWNRTIFDYFGVKAWARLLSDVAGSVGNVWSVWPPENTDENTYWISLVPNIVQEAKALKIFPIISSSNRPPLVSLTDRSILLAPQEPPVSLDVLAKMGVFIVQPPSYIFNILTSSPFERYFTKLSPASSYGRLRLLYASKPANHVVTTIEVEGIINYLVFWENPATSPALERLIDLPWFTFVDGSPTSLRSHSRFTGSLVVPSSEEETHLFDIPRLMLSWPCISDQLRDALSTARAKEVLNVNTISPTQILPLLKARFSPHSGKEEIEGSTADISWLLRFWKWISGWEKDEFNRLARRLGDLHILPTASGTLRRWSNLSILLVVDPTMDLLNAWRELGIGILHTDLANSGIFQVLQDHKIGISPSDSTYVSFISRNYRCDKPSSMTSISRDVLRSSLQSTLALVPRGTSVSLLSTERTRLSSLPIFSVRTETGEPPSLRPIYGNRRHVKVDNDCPLPILSRTESPVFVDMNDPLTDQLARLVDDWTPIQILNDHELLTLAVDHWSLQSQNLKEIFIERILENLLKFPPDFCDKLKGLAFVPVEGQTHLAAPRDVIDPGSRLAELYTGEPGKLPSRRFSTGRYFAMMQSQHFFRSELDPGIVTEHLGYLASSRNDKKAATFLSLLNDFWDESLAKSVIAHRELRWMPLSNSPSKCRDDKESLPHQHCYLYDHVFTILRSRDWTVSSPGLRKALGWSDIVPFDVLAQQFSFTIEDVSLPDRTDRLKYLVDYFAIYPTLSSLHFDELRDIVKDLPWVPVGNYGQSVSFMQYATLSATSLEHPFHQAQQALDVGRYAFLSKMGCTDRPSIDTLAAELGKALSPGSWSITAALGILHEIADYHQETVHARSDILIPADCQAAYPLANIYYQDMISDYVFEVEKYAAHPEVSKALSEKLRIPLLSSLQLEDDSNYDDLQMSEDLVGRIQGFLRENDIEFALNEFLANADDAGAKRLSMKLIYQSSHRAAPGIKVVSPDFQKLGMVPHLLIWNDSVFTQEDFLGIRRVGCGGKTHRGDTHGRHGLGALSLYYFTDVPTIISGDHILILDPSTQYLPPRRGQKRTSLFRKLSWFTRQFPDQLRSLHDNFNFTPQQGTYPGTLFFLPLLGTIYEQELPDYRDLLRKTYWDLAANAFFFTGLTDIKVEDGAKMLWHVHVINRTNPIPLNDHFTHHLLQFTRGDVTEDWVIATSEKSLIPTSQRAIAQELKFLPSSSMPVKLAIRVDQGRKVDLESPHLFSTLRLPKIISLPFHLHARFAISANRQELVFHAVNRQNIRDPKSSFNAWILGDLLCPLYLAALDHIIRVHPPLVRHKSRDWLIFKSGSDDVSSFVRESILGHLPGTDLRLFFSVGRNWLTFQQSVFSCDELADISDALTWLKAPSFVSDFRNTSVPTLPGARRVTAAYVMELLKLPESFTRVERLLKSSDTSKKGKRFEHLATLAQYVQAEADLVGLPIIVATTGRLYKVPSKSDPPIFVSSIASHGDLFPTSIFIQKGHTTKTINALTTSNLSNVHHLAKEQVADLIALELETLAEKCQCPGPWLRQLWDAYDSLPGPPSVSYLKRPDLKIIESSEGYITIADCYPQNVVQFPGSDGEQIVPIMSMLGINVLKSQERKVFQKYIQESFPNLLINVIESLRNKHLAAIDSLGEILDKDSHLSLIAWMRGYHPGMSTWDRPNHLNGVLLSLPIWEAHYKGRVQVLPAAQHIKVLPSSISLSSIAPYLRSDSDAMMAYSPSIVGSLSYYTGSTVQVMTIEELFGILELPNGRLQGTTQLWDYRKFLRGFLSHGCKSLGGKLQVPDSSLALRLPTELFSDQVALFGEALRYTLRPSFIHESFRDLTSPLYKMGLRSEIDFQNFQACATAVEVQGKLYLTADRAKRQEIMRMADSVFQCYCDTLPGVIKQDDSHWSQLDNITFVRRKHIRREGMNYDTEKYCTDLPPLLPPSMMLRPEFEPIAWAVRGLFFTEPSDRVLAVNKSLGVPRLDQVVDHLRILSTKIAVRHPGNTNLLSDLCATYKWLNNHGQEAQEFLAPLSDVPLFLNVDCPRTEEWATNWIAADQLVLDLRFATQKCKVVREFLQPYRILLLTAGCHRIIKQQMALAASVAENMSKLREVFNEMRSQQELTDMCLVPRLPLIYRKCANAAVGSLPAHKDFLAASIPHFRTLSRQVDQVEIEINHSPFVAKAILDFIYTGSINYPAPESEEDKMNLLQELCQLLYQSHEWDMPNLKHLLQKHIIKDHDMVQELPQAFRLMYATASNTGAEVLKSALDKFQADNGDVLEQLNDNGGIQDTQQEHWDMGTDWDMEVDGEMDGSDNIKIP